MNAALLGLAVAASGMVSGAQQTRPISLEAADCSRLNIMYGDLSVGRATQYAKVPLSAGTLNIRPLQNGGVQIERGAGSEYSVTACIAAGARDRAEAQRLAESARLRIDRNRVEVDNPPAATKSWSVHFILEVPDGGSVDAETINGPIGISGVSGKISARAVNGPIAVDDVSGEVMARATNGPISVSGSRGDIDASTTNGPVSVVLKGTRWEGRLEARANSGPLQVTVPPNYRSGVEISSRGGSPWDCRASACRNGSGDWDRGSRTLRVGPEPVNVRVSTINGPVAVQDGR